MIGGERILLNSALITALAQTGTGFTYLVNVARLGAGLSIK
jgi:hypothetical protein